MLTVLEDSNQKEEVIIRNERKVLKLTKLNNKMGD